MTVLAAGARGPGSPDGGLVLSGLSPADRVPRAAPGRADSEGVDAPLSLEVLRLRGGRGSRDRRARREPACPGVGRPVSHPCRMRRLPRPHGRERARGPGGRGRVVEFPRKRGKAAVLNDLVGESSAELIVFTDANTAFRRRARSASLAAVLAIRRVGAACGRLVLERRREARASETAFWDRETRLKEAEGRLGVCLGANGAIYAARRAWIEPLPDGAVLDDFLDPREARADGKRVVFVGDAVAREETAARTWRPRSRGVSGSERRGADPEAGAWLFNAAPPGRLSLVFLSRKAARWLAPVFALASAAAALGDPRTARRGRDRSRRGSVRCCCRSRRARAGRDSPAGSIISA